MPFQVGFFHLGWILFTNLAVAAASPPPGSAWEQVLRAEEERQAGNPALLRAAQSRDSRLRARATLAYGRIQRPEGVEPLLTLLADRDPGVREMAAFSLGQLGWSADFNAGQESRILARLQPLLADRSPGLRATVAEAIGKLGLEKASELLLHASPAFKDKDARVRAEVALSILRSRQILKLRNPLASQPEITESQLTTLLALAADRDVTVRRAASVYFSRNRTGEERALETLRKLSLDRDMGVRTLALAALARSGDAKMLPAVQAGLKDRELTVRISAALAFKALPAGTSAVFPPELDMDPSFQVRAVAAAVTTDEMRLKRLGADPSATVRGEVLKTRARLRKNLADPLLTEALGDPSWVLRVAAVEAGAEVEQNREYRLKTALKDSAPHVRAAALEQLGLPAFQESAWAFEALKTALASPELAIRGTAAGVLEKRKEKQVIELAWKTYEDSFDEKWVETREGLVEFIARTPGDATTSLLRKAVGDPSLSVALKARRALEARGISTPPLAQPAVVSHSPDRGMRFTRDPHLVFETTRGEIEIECFASDAPVHVANLIGHAKGGGYDGTLWHRVVPDFVIQGGDPDGTGWGSAGYSLRAEINRRRFERGTLGMPRSQGFDTGGVQLFITQVATPHLDGQYTAFGRVVRGMDVVDRIEVGDRILRVRVPPGRPARAQ